MLTDRFPIAKAIAGRLNAEREGLSDQWRNASPIRHFFLDDLLPVQEVRALAESFPDPRTLLLRSTLRERKRVGVDVSRFAPIVGEYLFAFQEPPVIQAISHITGMRGLEADPTLYASGVSLMGKGDFLHPHLDNSHDGDRKRYRVLNILFYASPDWKLENGGNLELWYPTIRKAKIVWSRFNRLVVMETHQANWHSVSKVLVDQPRCCISNYYFSSTSPTGKDYLQVTTFTGRPEEPLTRLLLRLDGILRNGIRQALPGLRRKTKHRLPAA